MKPDDVSGSRKLLFLPGAGGSPEFWRPAAEALPAAWRKVFLAWPGLGDQPPDPAVSSLDDLARLAMAALSEPSVLIAQSMGGVLALRLAFERPDLVARLVLVATSGGLDVPSLSGRDWRPEYLADFPNAPSWFMDARPDFSHRLGALAMPVLLIWGDADDVSPVSVGRELERLIPRARLVVVPGGRHDLAHRRAGLVAGLIEESLTRDGE